MTRLLLALALALGLAVPSSAAVPLVSPCDPTGTYCQAVVGPGCFATLPNAASLCSATPVTIAGAEFANSNASVVYCGLYNASAVANITLGTTLPVKYVAVPATGSWAMNVSPTIRQFFSIGVVVACETGYRNGTAVTNNTVYADVSF